MAVRAGAGKYPALSKASTSLPGMQVSTAVRRGTAGCGEILMGHWCTIALWLMVLKLFVVTAVTTR